MHRFSIIVPMLNDRRLFDDTLASVLRFRPDSSQIILAHDGTYDDPYRLGDEVDFVSTSKRAQMVGLFNCALQKTTGDYIALIRPGIQLFEGWDEPVKSKFENPNVASVSPIVVTPAQPQTIVAAGVNYGLGFNRRIVGAKSKIAPRTIQRIAPLGPTSWAAFYRKSALDQIGICGEKLESHYLDVDIALSLQTIGYTSEFCPDCVLEVERSSLIERELILPHGKSAQRAYRRHSAQTAATSPLVRSACVLGQELLLSPFQPWKLRHTAGRVAAWPMATLDRDYAEHLAQLAREFRETEETGLRFQRNDSENVVVRSGTSRRAA